MRTKPSINPNRPPTKSVVSGRHSVLAVVLSAFFFSLCGLAAAQQAPKIPRVGYVSGNSPNTAGYEVRAFQQGLRDLGYVDRVKTSSSIIVTRRDESRVRISSPNS